MDEKIQLITDSGAFLSPSEAAALRVAVMPMRVQMGDKLYREGVDISPQQYFALADKMFDEVPRISSPPLEAWEKFYREQATRATHLLVITQSRRLSNAFQLAEKAYAFLSGPVQVVVIDSETISYNQQILVRKAAQAIREGLSFAEVVRTVRGFIPHTYAEIFTDDLFYLQQYHRLEVSQAILGTMLDIKPLLLLDEGIFLPLEKVLDWEESVVNLLEFVVEFTHLESVMIVQRGFDDLAQKLKEALHEEEALQEMEFPVLSYNPSLAAHVGPHAFGVMVFEGIPERGFI